MSCTWLQSTRQCKSIILSISCRYKSLCTQSFNMLKKERRTEKLCHISPASSVAAAVAAAAVEQAGDQRHRTLPALALTPGWIRLRCYSSWLPVKNDGRALWARHRRGRAQWHHLERRCQVEAALWPVERLESSCPTQGNAVGSLSYAIEGGVGVQIQRKDLKAQVQVSASGVQHKAIGNRFTNL